MLRHILPTSTLTQARARRLRLYRETATEHRLWTQVRGRKLHGFKFRRQVPLGPFIADFLCVQAKLIVELDGPSHDRRRAYDRRRTLYFEVRGYRVIRYPNEKLYDELEWVLEDIAREANKTIQKTKQHTFSLPAGRELERGETNRNKISG